MKIDLLPKGLNYYKANLHSHSRHSDGGSWPEEMKEAYKSRGYDILAITDHSIFIPHNDLTDENFLMLNGLEYECVDWGKTERHCHFCAIAGDKETVLQPMYHRSDYVWAGGIEARKLVQFDASKPDYEREYSHACTFSYINGVSELSIILFIKSEVDEIIKQSFSLQISITCLSTSFNIPNI